ncbi:hypothetical protein Btru_029213 [Bulinus truncatus]|nr:hypothetical protein Btru_029213 [Bulinus truncatus]
MSLYVLVILATTAAKLECDQVPDGSSHYTVSDFTEGDESRIGFISQGVMAVIAVAIFIAMFYFQVMRTKKSKPRSDIVVDRDVSDRQPTEVMQVNIAMTDQEENGELKNDYGDTRH